MAQELLSTFEGEIGEMVLVPQTGGTFEVYANGEQIWSRKEQGGFPEIKQLKQIVRDAIVPERELGHIDRAAKQSTSVDA